MVPQKENAAGVEITMSQPVSNLKAMLASMSPKLNDARIAYLSSKDMKAVLSKLLPESIIGTFREEEAMTLIVELNAAENSGLEILFRGAWITLTVHSALTGVGLTAAFATALGNEGISANVMAAYYHDHIFVSVEDAERAMAALQKLQQENL
jgi:uncharacterized protein